MATRLDPLQGADLVESLSSTASPGPSRRRPRPRPAASAHPQWVASLLGTERRPSCRTSRRLALQPADGPWSEASTASERPHEGRRRGRHRIARRVPNNHQQVSHTTDPSPPNRPGESGTGVANPGPQNPQRPRVTGPGPGTRVRSRAWLPRVSQRRVRGSPTPTARNRLESCRARPFVRPWHRSWCARR